ncbi:hypothetical protein [Magnetovibrio blakemorei]|uniref:Uncharacterized protein n=1 Tax=Magnetovibrio blakemorei TaxID=28181 RepID=A0A1E5Q4A0_9PROT|nr:hypothetical protein [Magnetovibrio blakemorei]OEJ64652.1 hypothetical protein BEN30_00745 [Magnetovibrio blakemorei]
MDPFTEALGGGTSLQGGDAAPSDAFSDSAATMSANATFGDVITGGSGIGSMGVVVVVALALVAFAWLSRRKT